MNKNNTFNWFKFHQLGCELCEKNTEENLRTAINRFYYGSFCTARDYLINNKIFYNDELEEQICSKSPQVHNATKTIFKKEKKRINNKNGRQINYYLNELRKNRNKVDYDSKITINLKHIAKQSQNYSEKIFEIINELS